MLRRMIGSASLNAATYEEVEADSGATLQSISVVFLASLAAAIGLLIGGEPPSHLTLLVPVTLSLVGIGVGAWLLWALVIFRVGATFHGSNETQVTWGQVVRTSGFAHAPGVFFLLAFLPAVGNFISLTALLWIIAGMVVGIRQAMDYTSTFRALVVVIIGFVAALAVLLVGEFIAAGIWGVATLYGA